LRREAGLTTYDIFLAHAGLDAVRAETLFQLLAPGVNVFLDGESLLPADDADREIQRRRAGRS